MDLSFCFPTLILTFWFQQKYCVITLTFQIFHFSRYSELVGSGAFVTTADDMTKWMNFHLYEGSIGKGVKVMEEESVRELHKPRMALPGSSLRLFQQPAVPVATSFDIYALGWWRGYYRGRYSCYASPLR